MWQKVIGKFNRYYKVRRNRSFTHFYYQRIREEFVKCRGFTCKITTTLMFRHTSKSGAATGPKPSEKTDSGPLEKVKTMPGFTPCG